MNGPRDTDALIRDLVTGLEPRAPLPRLRLVGAITAAIALFLAALFYAAMAPVGEAGPWGRPIAGAHTLLALGALAAALAACIPGRERAFNVFAGVGVVGALLTLALGFAVITRYTNVMMPGLQDVWHATTCTLKSCGVALIPALMLAWFAAKSAPARPGLTIWLAAVGAVAIGALPLHLGCAEGELHSVAGHFAAPFTGSLVVLAAGWCLYRSASGSGA